MNSPNTYPHTWPWSTSFFHTLSQFVFLYTETMHTSYILTALVAAISASELPKSFSKASVTSTIKSTVTTRTVSATSLNTYTPIPAVTTSDDSQFVKRSDEKQWVNDPRSLSDWKTGPANSL